MRAHSLTLNAVCSAALAAALLVGCGGGSDMAGGLASPDTGDAGNVGPDTGGSDGGVDGAPVTMTSCVACATTAQHADGACFAATKACAHDEGCINLAACINSCPLNTYGSIPCMDECISFAKPLAVQLMAPVLACLCETTCQKECGEGCATTAPANGPKNGAACAAPIRLTRAAAGE